MRYKLQAYSIWEYGQRKDAQGRPHQEDCIYPPYGKQLTSDRLFILCDGMGGHDAGEVASATVCEAMSNYINSKRDAADHFTDDTLQGAIDTAFDALDGKDTGAIKKMGTTMTFLMLHEHGATIAHMGDSRVYHIRQGKTKKDTRILFETVDHSLVNDMVKVGELTPEEARHCKQKNVITRAMQPHMDRRPRADVYHTVDIKPGDYFFLCSDGMLENMEDEYIPYFFSREIASDEERVKQLTLATAENRDNHSALIIHILKVEDPIETTPDEASQHLEPLAGELSEADEADSAEIVSQDEAHNTATSRPDDNAHSLTPSGKNGLLIFLAACAILFIAVFAIKQFRSPTPKAVSLQPVERPATVKSGGTKAGKPQTTHSAEPTGLTTSQPQATPALPTTTTTSALSTTPEKTEKTGKSTKSTALPGKTAASQATTPGTSATCLQLPATSIIQPQAKETYSSSDDQKKKNARKDAPKDKKQDANPTRQKPDKQQ